MTGTAKVKEDMTEVSSGKPKKCSPFIVQKKLKTAEDKLERVARRILEFSDDGDEDDFLVLCTEEAETKALVGSLRAQLKSSENGSSLADVRKRIELSGRRL